jgi:hypothetical protein
VSGVSIGRSEGNSTGESGEANSVSESDTETEELGPSSWMGGAHSQQRLHPSSGIRTSGTPPWVVFDEQRVVTSLGHEDVDIWHFDL